MREAAMHGVARVSAVGLSATERWTLRLALALSLGGVGVAAYLVTLHAAIAGNPKRGLCTFTDTISCDKVLASPYAAIGPIPVALLGLAGFALLFAMALWRLLGGPRTPRWLPATLAVVSGLGLVFELVAREHRRSSQGAMMADRCGGAPGAHSPLISDPAGVRL